VTADFTPKPGQNIFRDVTTDPITGKPHKVKVCGPWLQFDEDEPIQLPEPGMHVRLWCSEGEKKALVRGHDTDSLYLVDADDAIDLGKVMGDYPAAAGTDGKIAIQRDNSRHDYSAEGIHHIEPDGRWVMNNDPALNYTFPSGHRYAGITLIQCDRDGEWKVGKCDVMVNSGIARYNMRTEKLEHFGQFSQFPPRCNRQGWVAIQGSEWKMTPEPDAVPWIRHEDLPATPGPIVTPPPPIVTPPPAPADCTAERALIALMKAEGAKLMDRAEAAEAELSAVTKERDDARRERLEDIRSRFTAAELLKLVNDATGQMAGYWRYLGVQGAVDRAVKAELAKRK
jgi:hypothetical protein